MKMKPLTNFPNQGIFCCDCGEFLGFSYVDITNAFCSFCVLSIRDLLQTMNFPDPITDLHNILDRKNRIGLQWSINFRSSLTAIRIELAENKT